MSIRQRKVPKLINLADVEPKTQEWFWYPYIPFGAAILLFGIGGAGKSSLTNAIAAAASTGRPLPGQKGPQRVLKSLVWSAEDDTESVLVPRLIRLGADRSKITTPDGVVVLDTFGMKILKDYQAETGAKIIVIDPAVAFMGGKIDMFKMNEVREFTGPLHQWAKDLGLVVIIAHHARKGSEGSDAERAAGSADFINGPRGALFLTKTSDGTRIMRHVKNNYGPLGQTLAYSLEDGGFDWGDFLTDDVPNTGGAPNSKSAPREAAVEFLEIILRTGPVPASEIEALAGDEGIAPATLQRAKAGLAESFARRENGRLVWYWRLKEKAHGKNRKAQVSSVGNTDRANRAARRGGDDVPQDPETPSPDHGDVRGLEGRGRAPRGPGEPPKDDPREVSLAFLRSQGLVQ